MVKHSYNFLVGNELNLLNGLKLTHDTILLDANDSNHGWHKCGADSRLGIRCGTNILDERIWLFPVRATVERLQELGRTLSNPWTTVPSTIRFSGCQMQCLNFQNARPNFYQVVQTSDPFSQGSPTALLCFSGNIYFCWLTIVDQGLSGYCPVLGEEQRWQPGIPAKLNDTFPLESCLLWLLKVGLLVSSFQKSPSESVLAKSKYLHSTAFKVQREHWS